MDIDDLALSSHPTARSVILLAPDSDDPDSEVIKTLLALTHAGPDGPRIVAEIRNPANLETARLVGAERTVLLDIRETVAKLVVQTSRQSGAAAVYTELFDYEGDEIYFLEDHGARRGDVRRGPARVRERHGHRADRPTACSKLNPPPSTPIDGQHADRDGRGRLGARRASRRRPSNRTSTHSGSEYRRRRPARPARCCSAGTSARRSCVSELDHYAVPGSTLTVLTSYGVPSVPNLDNLEVTVVDGSHHRPGHARARTSPRASTR